MFRILLQEPTWLFVILLLLIVIALACLPLLLMRKRIPFERLHEHREVLGITYGVIGVFYSLLFAFVLIGVWEDYEEAEENIFETASTIKDLVKFGQEAGAEHEEAITRASVHYLTASLEEWESVNHAQLASDLDETMDTLRVAVHSAQQNVPALASYGDAIFRAMGRLELATQERISIRSSHIPVLIWWVLCIGSVVCIMFLYLFKVHWLRLHMTIVSLVTLVIGLNLIIVFLLDHPFSGSTSVSPSPLIELLNSIQG